MAGNGSFLRVKNKPQGATARGACEANCRIVCTTFSSLEKLQASKPLRHRLFPQNYCVVSEFVVWQALCGSEIVEALTFLLSARDGARIEVPVRRRHRPYALLAARCALSWRSSVPSAQDWSLWRCWRFTWSASPSVRMHSFRFVGGSLEAGLAECSRSCLASARLARARVVDLIHCVGCGFGLHGRGGHDGTVDCMERSIQAGEL